MPPALIVYRGSDWGEKMSDIFLQLQLRLK
jgi:hypothetical protein